MPDSKPIDHDARNFAKHKSQIHAAEEMSRSLVATIERMTTTALMHLERNELQKAQDCASMVATAAPTYSTAHLILSKIALCKGDHPGSAAHFHNALEVAADHANFLLVDAYKCIENHQLESATKSLLGILTIFDTLQPTFYISPEQIQRFFQIATRQNTAGHRPLAELMLNILIRIAPDYGPAHGFLGIFATERGDHDASLIHHSRALVLLPNRAKVPLFYANALLDLNRIADGRAFLLEQTRTNAEPALVWHQLGLIALKEDDSETAIECFTKACHFDPGNAIYYRILVDLHLNTGMIGEAENVLAQGLAAAKDNRPLQARRVNLLDARGDHEGAIAMAHAILETDQSQVETRKSLIDLFIKSAQFAEAETELQCLTKNGDSAELVALPLAKLLASRFQLDEAADILENAIEHAPSEAANYQALAWIHLTRMDIASARRIRREFDNLLKHEGHEKDRRKWRHGFFSGLLNELASNGWAEQRLQKIRQLPLAERSAALVEEVISEPGYAGYPLALLVNLRHRGLLDQYVPDQRQEDIPRKIVQFWDSATIPEDVQATMDSWPRACAGFQHEIFNDASAQEFIAAHCTADILTAFRMAAHPAMRSDIFRLAYLFVRGGVYADADDLCRHDFSPILESGLALVLIQEYMGSIGNNFMAAAPGHPLIAAVLQEAVQRILRKQGDNVWFLTGPGVITHVFAHHYVSTLRYGRMPFGVRILTIYMLGRWISPHLPRNYKSDDRHWIKQQQKSVPLFRTPTPLNYQTRATVLQLTP